MVMICGPTSLMKEDDVTDLSWEARSQEVNSPKWELCDIRHGITSSMKVCSVCQPAHTVGPCKKLLNKVQLHLPFSIIFVFTFSFVFLWVQVMTRIDENDQFELWCTFSHTRCTNQREWEKFNRSYWTNILWTTHVDLKQIVILHINI